MGVSFFLLRRPLELKGADALPRHDAQPCYCGEPNCVGTIGGKTQTDIGGMNDLFLDGKLSYVNIHVRIVSHRTSALGITDEVEALGMKGSKKKKSRKLDEDFIVCLTSIGCSESDRSNGADES
jgi:histone-lysine N-methyltransferase SETD2